MDDYTTMNISLVAVTMIAFGGVLVYVGQPGASQRRALRWAERSGLPLSVEAARPLTARLRRLSIAEATSAIIGMAIAALLLPTAVGASAYFLLIALMPVLLCSLIGALAVNLRESLFTPAPDSQRVARLRALRAVNYLGHARIVLPWLFGAVAVIMAAAAVSGAPDAPAAVLWSGPAIAVLGVALCGALPVIDRGLLSRPQPAGSAVDLAWDDLFRTATLNTMRLTTAVIFLVSTSLSLLTLVGVDTPSSGLCFQLAVWGQIILARVYPSDGRGLRREIRPSSAALRLAAA